MANCRNKQCLHPDWAHVQSKCEAQLFGEIKRYEDMYMDMGIPAYRVDMQVVGECDCIKLIT